MYNTMRQQRMHRVERTMERTMEGSVGSGRTFQLRRFEGVPSYTGSLTPVSSFSQRDEDDLTTARRRALPAALPASSCHYGWFFLLVIAGGLLIMCMQFTIDMGAVRGVLSDRLGSRSLRSEHTECPVCVCNTT